MYAFFSDSFTFQVIVKHWVKFPVLHSRKDGRSSWEPEVADGAHPRKWSSETTARHSCPQGQEQWSFSLRSTHTYFLRKQHGQAWGPRGAGESSGWIHDYMSESEAAQEKAGVTLTLSTLAPVFDVDIAAGLVEPQGELCGVSPKNRVAIWFSDPTPEHISRKNYNSKIYMHTYIHSSTVYNSHDMEAT